jgi:uridine kinase
MSGVSGAGKTTLAKALAKVLQATLIQWDDFDEISEGPDDYVDWYNRGRDYKEWNYQALADVLHALKHKKTIDHPVLGEQLFPTEYIIFDAPLGRLHHQTGQYLDVCVHIEVPLDVSLSRRLIRDFKSNDKAKDNLLEELEHYLSVTRPLFFDDHLKENADLCIDGMLSTDQQVASVLAALKHRAFPCYLMP